MVGFIDRFARSWQLIKASAAILRSDRELLVLPLFSGLATMLVGGAFVALAMDDGTFAALQTGNRFNGLQGFYIWLFVFYVVQYFIIYFFNTALVGAAIERLGGGDPTIGSALALAVRRIGPVFGYAILSATVGLLLRLIAERLGFIGRLIEGVIGLAWTAATFLAVPVLAAEGVGPFEAVTRSTALLKKTWGESLIGGAGISVVMSAVAGLIGFVGIGGGMMLLDRGDLGLGIPLIAVSGVLLLGLILVGSALTGIYTAAIYYYAVMGKAPDGFDGHLIRDAFRPKG